MKYQWNKKYVQIGLLAFFVIAASICFYYLIYDGVHLKNNIYHLLSMAMPIIDGLIVAYLLTPLVNLQEDKLYFPLFKKLGISTREKGKSKIRMFSIAVCLIFVLLIFYGFIRVVIPQLIRSIQNIVIQFPLYAKKVTIWSEKILSDHPEFESLATTIIGTYSKELNEWLNYTVLPTMNGILKTLSLSVLSFVKSMWNLIIGFIISVYVLANKEKFAGQAKKLVYAILDKKQAVQFIEDVHFTDRTFGGFIRGKLLDSLMIGVICLIVTNILGTPYAVLISVIVGVTDIIPFFGPYLGAIPSALLILIVDPLQCLYFIIFILILQQIDGNIIAPKILGNSTGLSGFWVIFAITIFGGLFGILGMVIGVPVFAVIYELFSRKIYKKLHKRGLPTETEFYSNPENMIYHESPKEQFNE